MAVAILLATLALAWALIRLDRWLDRRADRRVMQAHPRNDW